MYPRLPPKLCLHCQQSFQPKKGRQTLCSRHCSAAYANAAKRAEGRDSVPSKSVYRKPVPSVASLNVSPTSPDEQSIIHPFRTIDSEQERIALVQATADAYQNAGEHYEHQTRSVLKRERNRTIIL